eukprot:TRINITY_DN15155_c0_g1_i1.p2 TRINITY_DN15155_c0_g1~~TRINITY_DN15155_c0_g1_i1.p2  ORF type:complete len:139 (+),score=22.07 TRINITY_DN15155_c0_g1_i1:87-503(+)
MLCCAPSEGDKPELVTAVPEEKKPTVKTETAPEAPEAPVSTASTAPTEQPKPTAEPVTFTFSRPDGSTIDCSFKARPLGIDFVRKVPLVVKAVRPGTSAEKEGVQSGWKLLKVDGEDHPDTFEATSRLIEKYISRLPV